MDYLKSQFQKPKINTKFEAYLLTYKQFKFILIDSDNEIERDSENIKNNNYLIVYLFSCKL